MKLKIPENTVPKLRIVLCLASILAASSLACKPRSESSLAAARGSKSGSTTQVPRPIVATLGIEDSECKVKAAKFATWAKYWATPNAVTERVETPEAAHLTAVNAVAVKLHSTAGAHIEWLKTAKEVSKSGERGAGQTSVDTGDLDATIQVYEEVQTTLSPILDSRLWSRWDASFGDKVRKAFSTAADGYEATLGVVSKWKPTDDDKALDALEAAQAQGGTINVKPPEATGGEAPASQKRNAPPEPIGSAGAPPVDATEPVAQPAEKLLPKKSAQQLAQEAFEREREAQRQRAEEEQRQAEEAQRKAEEQRLAWLTFVQDAARALSDGNGSGTYPTIEQVEAAIKATEAQRPYNCNDGKPGNLCRGKPLIELLSKVHGIAGLYSDFAGVGEGYTVQEHTERVLEVYFDQRDKYGYPESDKRYRIMMPVVVALHDIGKPVAVRTQGSTESQHVHNAKIVAGVLRSIGFTEDEVRVGKTIVSGDILGNHVKNGRHYSYTYPLVVSAAKQAGISKLEFMKLLRVEYVADANAYPGVRNSAFWQEQQSGRLVSRNNSLESLYEFVKGEEQREINEKLAAEKAARDKIAAEKAAAEKVERDRIAAEKAAQQQASVQTELKEDKGTDLGPIGEQSALEEVEKKSAAQTQKKPAAPAQPDPPFVGRRYNAYDFGVEFMTSGKCHYYWDRQRQPKKFVACTWSIPVAGQILVTFESSDGQSNISLQYRSVQELVYASRSGNFVLSSYQ